LPKHRTTLVAGTSGSGKTVLAAQFLAGGIKNGESGVFVTFEESADDICRNLAGFGWDVRAWEADGKWAFVDASPDYGEAEIVGEFDLGALLARIEHAVQKVQARRVAVDSLGALFLRFRNERLIRHELLRIAAALKRMEVTTVITSERVEEYGPVSRLGGAEFASDNVVILRNTLDSERRRRTIEVLKLRGTSHQKGEYLFTVVPGRGLVVLPLSAISLQQKSSEIRTTSGSEDLDRMCGGGFFRNSVVLVSSASGCGKTLMVAEFVAGGVASKERCMILAFEESREQLSRNASGWGVDFQEMEDQGRLKIVCEYPEVMSLEDHLIRIKSEVEAFRPSRVAVDSLSALERVSTRRGFREFAINLAAFIKNQEICGLFTATTPGLTGGSSVTEAHVSTITDSIILLRYVEMQGEMRRAITVLKMRGSAHDKGIFEYSIDGQGMHIGNPLKRVSGILTGKLVQGPSSEVSRVSAVSEDSE
jgi:circadian clock protein KaiC